MDGRLCKLRNLNVFHIVIYSVCLSYFFRRQCHEEKFGIVCRPFVLAVINALIVEHLTIYNVVLACGVLVYTICVHRKVVASHVAYLIGSVAGAAYMFFKFGISYDRK